MANLFQPSLQRASDPNYSPAPGAEMYFYQSGTTEPLTIYSDLAGTVEQTNPVEANSAGLFPSVYLDPTKVYRVVLQTAEGGQVWDVDPVRGFDESQAREDALAVLEAADVVAADAAQVAADKALVAGYATAALMPNPYSDHATARAALSNGQGYWYQEPGGLQIERWLRVDASTSAETSPPLHVPTVDGLAADKAGGELGDLFLKSTDADGQGFDWTARSALNEQLETSINVNLTAGAPDVCEFTATSTTPTGAYTAVSSSKIQITHDTFNWKGLTTPYKLLPNRAYVVTYLPTDIDDTTGGIGIGFDPVAPTPGSTTVRALASGFFAMQYRILNSAGATRALYDHAGIAAPSGPEISNSNGALSEVQMARTAGEEFSFRLEMDSTGTIATIYYLDANKNYIGGSGGSARTTITQVPEGSYLWIGVHDGTTGSQALDVTIGPGKIYSPSIDISRRIYADASLSAYTIIGAGTQDDPLLEPDEIARFITLDKTRRQFRVKLKSGVYSRPLVIPDASLIDELWIDAPVGKKATIQPADELDQSGWTNVGGASPNVWIRDALFGFIGLTDGNSSVIEVPGSNTTGLTQTFGTGAYTHTVQWYLYTRFPPNTDIATINATPASYSMHSTGTHAGKILVHARASGDPNDMTFMRPMATNGVSILATAATNWNMPRIHLSGIECKYTASEAFRFQRCIVEHSSLIARATSLYGVGFQYDECFVRAYGSLAEGTTGDHVNMSGTYGGLPDDLQPEIVLDGFKMLGALVPAAASGLSGGDNISNHVNQHVIMRDCYGLAASKDGLSGGGNCRLTDCEFSGAANAGVHLYPTTAVAHTLTAKGCEFYNNDYGVMVTGDVSGANPGTEATAKLLNCEFAENSIADIFANGTDATITLRGRQGIYGAEPSSGSLLTQADGVINDYRSTEIV